MPLASIVPTLTSDGSKHAMSDAPEPVEWLYELRPPRALPVIDFSLSLKSQYLNRRAAHYIDVLSRYRHTIGTCAFGTNALVAATFVVPARSGRVLGILAPILWIPVVIKCVSAMRPEMAHLLHRTYDYWFSSCVNLSVAVAIALLLGDVRGVAVLALWSGIQINITIDASIRRIRSIQLFNVLAIALYVLVWTALKFSLVDGLADFALMRYRNHELTARAFVLTGIVTTTMFICRNVYRRRGILSSRTPLSVIECATFRTDLRIYAVAAAPQHQEEPRSQSIASIALTPEYMKPLKYIDPLGRIDARDTVLKRSVREWLSRCVPLRSSVARVAIVLLQYAALSMYAVSTAFQFHQVHSHVQPHESVHYAGFALTLAYCGLCALHYQRTLLFALATTFDFVFFTAQVLAMHICTCQFFSWSSESVFAVVTAWMWAQWFLCLDALPPVMLRTLCVTARLKVAALSLLVASALALMYFIMFTDVGSSAAYEEVMWQATLFGHHHIEIKWANVFFSSVATVTTLSPRHVWRAVTLETDVLLLLDGAVVYENYLQQTHMRASRRIADGVRRDPSARQAEGASVRQDT